MRTSTLIIGIGIITAAIAFDIVEVKVHTGKAGELAAQAVGAIKKPGIIETGITLATNYWREIEYATAKGEEAKMTKVFTYATSDIEYLQEAITRSQNSAIIPRLTLLIKSLERIRAQSEKVPIEYLAQIKEQSRDTFANAGDVIAQAKEKGINIAALEEGVAKVAQEVENQLGPLNSTTTPQVVGAQDQAQQAPTPSPSISTAPLRF